MTKYDKIIERVFFNNYHDFDRIVPFDRNELAQACDDLGIARIKNLGDIPYTYRFRKELPDSVNAKLPDGADWIIVGKGTGRYEFRIASPGKIQPTTNRLRVKIPDATPEIVKKYAPGTDEQALLTKVRYNRLVDLFSGLTCYSIQNHLRTNLPSVGQIEIDEVYLGVNKKGTHFVIPCQAKSPGDRFGIVQVMQDIEFCKIKYPYAVCKPIALQFLSDQDVAILELAVEEVGDSYRLSVVDERHYTLVSKDGISYEEIAKQSAEEDI
ncbi:endonuclease [Vibrio navarrensis]|uniref:endonuclease n=1 Tax=Vibrio navarrensis TaxID=29495 RepID=UPI00186A7B76|nr:endonuclease [Vibrio navarrensis]MBE4590652.1 endonuclease [Vibrio navarrensis]